jgi:hypothetical protein
MLIVSHISSTFEGFGHGFNNNTFLHASVGKVKEKADPLQKCAFVRCKKGRYR